MVEIPEDLRDAEGPSALEAIRALRQQLKINRDFGWDMPVAAGQGRVAVEASPPAGRAGVAKSPAAEEAGTAGRETASAAAGSPGQDKGLAREALEAEVAGCKLCGLCEGRTNTVFGVGDPGARLLFVGEGPGRDEDLAGEPFVGKAGQLLNDIINKGMGLEREQVYIANIVKCRPPENRNPAVEEIAACMPYLRRQIEIIQPEVICALGGVAAKALLSSEASVGSLRGEFHDYDGIPVRVTYHPAYLLRSPHEKRKTWQDIKAVMARLSLPPPSQA